MFSHVRIATAALAAVSACFAVSAASAQSTGQDWNGFYAGLHAGYGWGEEHDNLSEELVDVPIGGAADSFDLQGVLGGAHFGYDWQHGPLILGIEGSFDGSGVDGKHFAEGIIDLGDGDFDELEGNLKFEQLWQGALVGKAGTAFGNVQLYGLGGVAFSGGKLSFSGGAGFCFPAQNNLSLCEVPVDGISGRDDGTHVGFVVGAGGQLALSKHWSAMAEGRFEDFGKETYTLFEDSPQPAKVDVDFNLLSVIGGFSYHF